MKYYIEKTGTEYSIKKQNTTQGSKEHLRNMYCTTVSRNSTAHELFRYAVCTAEFVVRNKCTSIQNINS